MRHFIPSWECSYQTIFNFRFSEIVLLTYIYKILVGLQYYTGPEAFQRITSLYICGVISKLSVSLGWPLFWLEWCDLLLTACFTFGGNSTCLASSLVQRLLILGVKLSQLLQSRPTGEYISWIPCKLVIPSRFISWKNSFSDIGRKCILPKND